MPDRWWLLAACRGTDPKVFYPSGADREEWAEARAICAVCPVDIECLAEGRALGERDGIRAGVDLRRGNRWRNVQTAQARRDRQVERDARSA